MRTPRTLRNAVKENRKYRESEQAEWNLSLCDYFRGKGSCSMGNCWTEPRCQTDMPMTGWPKPWVLKRGGRK